MDVRYIDGDIIKDATPEDLAIWFADMDDEGQARFFNRLAARVELWGALPETQWLSVSQNGILTDKARDLIHSISEYTAVP